MNELLTTADLAREKGVSPSAISQAVTAGRIAPAIKLPGKRGAFLFTREAVDAFKAGKK